MFRELYYWAYMIYYPRRKAFKNLEEEYAWGVIIALMEFNWISLLIIVDRLFIGSHYFSFIDFLFKGKGNFLLTIIIFMLPIFTYSYFQIYKKRKEIIQHYKEKKMSQFRQDWGKLFFWLYVIFTLVLFFSGLIILKKLRSETGM